MVGNCQKERQCLCNLSFGHRRRLMKILLAGGFNADNQQMEQPIRGFCAALGRAVVDHDLGYRCAKVTQANAGDQILPDILDCIRRAASTIVDLTTCGRTCSINSTMSMGWA
jgi:hypothetical protein